MICAIGVLNVDIIAADKNTSINTKNDFNLNLEKSLNITYIPKKISITGTAYITLPIQPSNTLFIRPPIIPFEPLLYTKMLSIIPSKIKDIDVASILISLLFFFFLAT